MKNILVIIGIVILMVGVTGCRKTEEITNNSKVNILDQNDKDLDDEAEDAIRDNMDIIEMEDKEENTNNDDIKDEIYEEKNKEINIEESNLNETKVTGIYQGQIDNNSIEVLVQNNPVAYFFSEEFKNNFIAKDYKSGDTVEVTYYINEYNQFVLVKMEVVNLSVEAENKIEVVGKYVGQIDNNSIEIIIDTEAHAFYFSEEIKNKFSSQTFKKGDEIKITYYINEVNQKVILELK